MTEPPPGQGAPPPVTCARDGAVAVIEIDAPPVNALSQPVRAALLRALDRAEADPEVRAIVICAAGRTFPAGADIREFARPPVPPRLAEVCDRIEGCRLPVVAALHGTALGGGFEIALAAHWRVAETTAQLGLPEITLGLLPGAGGTWRLPRIVGAAAALDLMLSGRPVTAAQAAAMGIVDRLTGGPVRTAAVALAADLAVRGGAPRRTRDRTEGLSDPSGYLAAVASARAPAAARPVPAAARIVAAVEAALLLPIEAAAAFEAATFEDCLASPESAALRHAFLAERRAARAAVPAATRAPSRPVILGDGPAAAELAAAALLADLPVHLVGRSEATLVDAMDRIEAEVLRSLPAAGPDAEAEARAAERLARLTLATGGEVPEAADLLILAPADPGATAETAAAAAAAAPGLPLVAVLPSAAAPAPPIAAAGLDLPLPLAAARLTEVIALPDTPPAALAAAAAFLRRIGRVPLRARPPGILRALLAALWTVTDARIEAGLDLATAEAAFTGAGFARGPGALADLAAEAGAPPATPLARYLAARGLRRLAGGAVDPAAAAAVAALRAEAGILPRAVAPAELRFDALAAMANAGARLVSDGIAARPSDVDVAALHGLGFPRWEGGPMHWADARGLLMIRNALRELARDDPATFAPDPLWDELIKNGRRFADLDGL
jgi:3-hydroxyacyl-CoA dehydrogenase